MGEWPEDRTRIWLDERLREQFPLDPYSPCAMQATDPDYCGGTVMAEYIELPSDGGPTTDPDNVETLCRYHHNRKAVHRYQHAFLRDQEQELGTPHHLDHSRFITGGLPWS